MIYTKEDSLWAFPFWSGAIHNAEKLTSEEMEQVEAKLPELLGLDFCSIPRDVDINDLFWHDFDAVCKAIGLDPKEVESRE